MTGDVFMHVMNVARTTMSPGL